MGGLRGEKEGGKKEGEDFQGKMKRERIERKRERMKGRKRVEGGRVRVIFTRFRGMYLARLTRV